MKDDYFFDNTQGYALLTLEKGEGGEKERRGEGRGGEEKKHSYRIETSVGCLPYVPAPPVGESNPQSRYVP